MENKTKKNKTAVAAKTEECRISNKKIERLHKIWDSFPGLKKSLFLPVEGEDYSLIKSKDLRKTINSNAGVKRLKKAIDSYVLGKGVSLALSLQDNPDDYYPVVLKQAIKDDIRHTYSTIPLINIPEIMKVIDQYWPLVEEYHKTIKDGGITAITKHPLYISAAKFRFAHKVEKEESLKHFGKIALADFMIERAKYISVPDTDLKLYNTMRDLCQRLIELWNLTDEEIATRVNRQIENLNEDEINTTIDVAFFIELRHCVKTEFICSIDELIYKLSA